MIEASDPTIAPSSPVAGPVAPSWFLAALLAGAGLVHLVMVPTHLGLSGVDGAGFLVAGWVQVGLAVLVVARPRRWVWGTVLTASAALLVLWIVSRSAGLPVGSHAGESEPVSFVDGVTAGLEAAAFLVAGAALRGRVPNPGSRPLRAGLAGVGVVAALALATGAVASPSARGHGGSGHGHDAAASGHGHGDGADGAGSGHGHAGEADDLGYAALANGQMGDHHHGDPDSDAPPVEPSIDPGDAGALAEQLALTAPLVEAYPTVAEAKAAGYRQAGPFSPGLGTHYNPPTYSTMNTDGVMDAADIENAILIYDGTDDEAPLAGFMYMAYQETEPEGFVGDLDRWHYHTAVCVVFNEDGGIDTPFGADLTGVTEEMCQAEGGSLMDFTGYMVHVWTVPGYESSEGVFSDLNPTLTCPDGTYHRIPISDIGDARSTCLAA